MWLPGKRAGTRRERLSDCQAVDQRLRPRAILALAKAVWAGSKGSVTSAAERHQIDAEADIDGADLVLEEAHKMRGSRDGALKPASITVDEPSAR